MTLRNWITAALRRGQSLMTSRDTSTRTLVVCALFSLLTFLMSLLAWMAADTPSLAGSVSWRKPMVFGISGALVATAPLPSWVRVGLSRPCTQWLFMACK